MFEKIYRTPVRYWFVLFFLVCSAVSRTTGQTPLFNKVTVFVFLSTTCPLCQNYTLTLNQMAEHYEKQGLRIYGIIPGTYTTDAERETFVKTYRIQFPVYRDTRNRIVKKLGATITPEVFVFNTNKQLVYSGRIDNWAYEVGKKRTHITEHNLRDVIEQILAGKMVVPSKTKAIGCYIEE